MAYFFAKENNVSLSRSAFIYPSTDLGHSISKKEAGVTGVFWLRAEFSRNGQE